MTGAPLPSPPDLARTAGPAELLARARALEPPLRLGERGAVLSELETLLDSGRTEDPPTDRDWRLELVAERAVDASILVQTELALRLAGEVLLSPETPGSALARARARWARGRALAWAGTDVEAAEGARELEAAVEAFAALGQLGWEGYARVWIGHAVHFENGRPEAAERAVSEGLERMGPDSPWRPTALVFLADAQIELGRLDTADATLTEAAVLAERRGDTRARSYVSWNRAHVAAARGDRFLTERLLGEVERAGGDWSETHLGVYFLADAAILLDTLGLTDRARRYLRLAEARDAEGDDYVVLARAMMLARTGEPNPGEETLQEVARNEWVENRLAWRATLLLAWCRLRAGSRDDAAATAGRAFDQAVACGGLVVAQTAEPLMSLALAPLADEAGSTVARTLFAGPGELVVRLFGTAQVTGADGRDVPLAPGMPGVLVRMLALAPYGLAVDAVLDTFFPNAAPAAARQRLRQVLTRLRATSGDLVRRDEDLLTLAPAWVDLWTFTSLTTRALSGRGAVAVTHAHAALALSGRGPFLPADPYASWADEARTAVAGRLAELTRLSAPDPS